jgi:cysteine-rich repeat protein
MDLADPLAPLLYPWTLTAPWKGGTSLPGPAGATPPNCGDGNQDADEACDDGNADDNDACLSTCVVASCGDGFVRIGVEGCDDGNQDETDACLSTCVSATWGDGVVAAVVDDDDFGGEISLPQPGDGGGERLFEPMFFVVGRHDNGEFGSGIHEIGVQRR